jgi:hypothetical protein
MEAVDVDFLRVGKIIFIVVGKLPDQKNGPNNG